MSAFNVLAFGVSEIGLQVALPLSEGNGKPVPLRFEPDPIVGIEAGGAVIGAEPLGAAVVLFVPLSGMITEGVGVLVGNTPVLLPVLKGGVSIGAVPLGAANVLFVPFSGANGEDVGEIVGKPPVLLPEPKVGVRPGAVPVGSAVVLLVPFSGIDAEAVRELKG